MDFASQRSLNLFLQMGRLCTTWTALYLTVEAGRRVGWGGVVKVVVAGHAVTQEVHQLTLFVLPISAVVRA